MRSVGPSSASLGTPDLQTLPTARKISSVSAVPQLARLVADGAVWSYPVSAKGGPAFGGNPQTEKPVEIQEGSSFSSFSTRTRGSSSFAIRLFSALSGFNHECQRRSIRFPYSELTAFVTCWSPHASSTGVVRAGIEFASIKFSIRQSQPPGRLKEGRVVNPPEAAPTVTHCRKRLYVSSANVRRREHLSGYRSRQARVGDDWSFWF